MTISYHTLLSVINTAAYHALSLLTPPPPLPGDNERDMIVMRHDVGITWPDHTSETRHIDLTAYGQVDGYSAMTATVGFPAGIAAKMILDGSHDMNRI